MTYIVMWISHLLKIIDAIATGGLPRIPLDRLPALVVAWAQYAVKLIRIYAAVFFSR